MKIYNFVCFGVTLENLFLGTFDFEFTYIKMWCYASGVYKWV